MTDLTNTTPIAPTNPIPSLSPVQQVALTKALALLRGAGCKYKVLTPCGAEFGELKLAPPPAPARTPKRRPSKYPYGSLKAYYWPLVGDMTPGQVVCIQPREFDIARLRSAITADLSAEWGRGTFITTVTKGADAHIEILRVE